MYYEYQTATVCASLVPSSFMLMCSLYQNLLNLYCLISNLTYLYELWDLLEYLRLTWLLLKHFVKWEIKLFSSFQSLTSALKTDKPSATLVMSETHRTISRAGVEALSCHLFAVGDTLLCERDVCTCGYELKNKNALRNTSTKQHRICLCDGDDVGWIRW